MAELTLVTQRVVLLRFVVVCFSRVVAGEWFKMSESSSDFTERTVETKPVRRLIARKLMLMLSN